MELSGGAPRAHRSLITSPIHPQLARPRANRFVAELQRQAEQSYNNLFTHQQLYQVAQGPTQPQITPVVQKRCRRLTESPTPCLVVDLHLQIPNMDDFVESLNHHGYLLKKGNRVYKVQTSTL